MSVAPRLPGCSGLPSILIGRPSNDFPRTPVATPPRVIAVAKNSGLPGIRSSGWVTYGTIFSGGWITQPDSPASASDAPITFMKWRRESEGSQFSTFTGNSPLILSSNSADPANSSMLRQYCLPLCERIISRVCAKPFLLSGLGIVISDSSTKLLSMTDRTTRHHFLAADLVLFLKRNAVRLIEIAVLPLHVVDLRLRPDKLLRFAVARKAPFHLERILLIDRGHIVNLAVASRTPDSLCNVNAVVEVGVLRQVVNAFPFNRLVIAETCSY